MKHIISCPLLHKKVFWKTEVSKESCKAQFDASLVGCDLKKTEKYLLHFVTNHLKAEE